MRIQAATLLETGKPQLVQAAFGLVQRACSEYPEAMDRAWGLEIAGQCCDFLGRVDDAIEFYRQALARERAFPGMRSNAAFQLAKVVVENRRRDLYGEALTAAEAHGAPVFPSHAYYLNGIRAVVAKDGGRVVEAKAHAGAALKAAEIRDTGLSHGRGRLGTVRDVDTPFHRMLVELKNA
jgi:tetratricopeptide (TPR) repeat protein